MSLTTIFFCVFPNWYIQNKENLLTEYEYLIFIVCLQSSFFNCNAVLFLFSNLFSLPNCTCWIRCNLLFLLFTHIDTVQCTLSSSACCVTCRHYSPSPPSTPYTDARVLKKLSLAGLAKLCQLKYRLLRFGLASAGYRGLVVHSRRLYTAG
jgi:hypothetical protein